MHVYNIHDESMQMLVVHLRIREDRLDVRHRRACTRARSFLVTVCLSIHELRRSREGTRGGGGG
jgi:hypothetical protein